MNSTNYQLPITNYQLGLIGYPLGHSLSPKIHAAAFNACGLQGIYSLFPIHPEDRQGLKDLLARVRSGEITGLNVTIPHKQNVIELMDELTPTAKAIGAVNTIYMRENKLVGDNTDAPGFLADLKRVSNSSFIIPHSALVLGAGGSARAVVYALLYDGWGVTVAARQIEQAQQLSQSFGKYDLRLSTFDFQPSTFTLIVNTTPLGMTPNTETSPLPENVILSKHTFIYDLVYNPRETKLVKDARAQGLSATTGLGMLIEQAALAFEKWTGAKADRDAMQKGGRMNRLLVSAQDGWQGARENLIPGLVIIFFAGLLVSAYYAFASLRDALEGLQSLRNSWGLGFSMLTSAIGAGVLPGLYLMAVGKSPRDSRGFLNILFTSLIWATNMIWVDNFYNFQDWFWGPSATFGIVISKMLLDQFVFTAFLSIHHVGIGFRLRDLNYDFKALGRALKDDWIIKVTIPMLVNCWLTWIPGTLVVYSLPLPLQIPLMVLIQFFFALEMAFVSSKMADPVAL